VLVRSLSAWGKPQLRPIGICKGSAFSGTFDGQGNIIHYLSMSHDSAPVWNLGLFGYVTGQVRNLHSEIMAYEVGMNSHRIAFLAGTCDGGLIANCTTSGSIEAGMQSRCIGLLVGRCDGGTIENCSTEGSISVGANSESVGELVGYSRGEIVNCTSNVTVTAGEGSTDIGGLVGFEPEPRR